MDVTLEVTRGSQRTRVIHLRRAEITVGRKRGSNLRIPAASVSRRHCRLVFQDGFLVVEDLGSFNGTFVNGKRVRDREFVRPGDELKIGPVTFVARYGVKPEEDRPILIAVPIDEVSRAQDSIDLSQDFGEALFPEDI